MRVREGGPDHRGGLRPGRVRAKFWYPERKKHIIHIDFTPAEVDGYYQPAVEVVADVREALELLNGLVKGQKDPAPYRALRGYILEQLAEGADDDTFPIKPQRILRDLRAVMGREDILISDVGSHKLWIARTFPAYEPNSVLISNGLAAMGFALPAAVAAKLVHPERNVVAVSGDGGFLMNVQELETAKRLGLAVVNVIFRDGGYNLIQWKQQTRLGRESGVAFTNPDFVALARAFGATGFRVDWRGPAAGADRGARLRRPLHRGRAGGLPREPEADRAPRPPGLPDLLTARALLCPRSCERSGSWSSGLRSSGTRTTA